MQEKKDIYWPLDLLPEDCPDARILTWGYDSQVSHFFGGPTNQSNIPAHARNLLHGLKTNRVESVSLLKCLYVRRLTKREG